MNPNIHVQVFHGLEGFLAIQEDWNRIAQALRHKRFFHLYPWYHSYLTALEEEPQSVHFVVIYHDQDARAIIPLRSSVQRFYGLKLRVLGIPSHSHLPLSDFICDHPQASAQILARLTDYLQHESEMKWDVLMMPRVLEDSAVLGSLASCSPARTTNEVVGRSNYLVCDSYEAFSRRISKNFRGNLRKARNKLQRLAGVQFQCIQTGKDLEGVLDEFMALEASGWKGQDASNSAIQQNRRLKHFYRTLASRFSKIDGCEINTLRANGDLLAAQFCLRVDDTLYVLKIGYNETFSKVAPGNMLLEHVLQEYSAGEDIKYISLLTDTPWHRDWKPQSKKVYRVTICNRTAGGWAAYALLITRNRIAPHHRRRLRSLLRPAS